MATSSRFSTTTGYSSLDDDVLKAKMRSRKWMLTVGLVGVATLALFTGQISGDNFTNIAVVALGVYPLANAATTYAERKYP